jgi:hypothetical protein
MAGTLTVREICQVLKRGRMSVKERARKMGISLAVMGEKHHAAIHPDEAVETARTLHERGWSYWKIAAEHGWPVATVKHWIYYHNRRDDLALRMP